MGDPRKQRAKFSGPRKAWEKERIDEEKELIREYHFKNKAEIWKLTSKLRSIARQTKRLIKLTTEQSEKEKILLLTKLRGLGLITEAGDLDDVLGIAPKDLFDRRLQSIVFKKGLAKTMKQARQFITHEHVLVNGIKITSPNYLVKVSEESSINFTESSALADEMHPERKQEEKLAKKLVKEDKAKDAEEDKKSEDKKPEEKKVEKKKSSEKEKPKKKASKKKSE